MDCVKRKKDEFERDMSPCNLLRYPRCVKIMLKTR